MKKEILRIKEEILKFNLEVIITIFSIVIGLIGFFKIMINVQYKSSAEKFYNVPSYLFEVDIFKFIYTPIFLILILGVGCIGLKIMKEESKEDANIFLLIFSIVLSLLNTVILLVEIGNILFYLKSSSISKYYNEYFLWMLIILWILFLRGYYKKRIWIKYVGGTTLIIFLALFIFNLLKNNSLDAASRKNYEILQDENKVVISEYQGNYICMDYEDIDNGIRIDTTSYMLIPISNKKLKYKVFKNIEIRRD